MNSIPCLKILVLAGLVLLATACSDAAANTTRPTASLATPTLVVASPTPRPSPTATQAPTATQTPTATPEAPVFDGQRAYQDVEYQVGLGPRLPGSQAHDRLVGWLQEQLTETGWAVELQETTYQGQPVRNVIAKRGEGQVPWVILGAHYDSRLYADRDPDLTRQKEPVPGANDGASGVAVLLELARVLPADLDQQVWLVFFDAEDQGRIPGWDWILGSRAFVESLSGEPDSVIIVDMIGDADLNILMEGNSSPELTMEIWRAADEIGYGDVFIPEYGRSILDDHTPFLERGLRAIDIIDFSYPYWHTVDDTPDKVSASSLQAVGDTLLHWLLAPQPTQTTR